MNGNNIKPPGWIQRLINRYCDPYLIEGIYGDLEELFFENVALKGPVKAKLIYFFQSLGFFRRRFKKRSKKVSNMKAIWTNYLLTSFRSLKRHKVYFTINLIGLITAISCSLYAMIYIHDELQFDNKHIQSESIYRLYKRHINVAENQDFLTWETSGLMGPTMKEEYSQVTDIVRVCPWFQSSIVSYDERNIKSEMFYFADSNFFDFFDFKILAGDKQTMLKAPASMAISQSLSRSLFGDKNPIGESVIGYNDLNYTITGVFEDTPRQSNMQFDAIISWSTTVPNVGPLQYNWMNNWLAQGIFTYIKLTEGSSPEQLVEELPDMMNRHFSERADQYFLKLLPFRKVHLYGDNITSDRGTKTGSITFIYILGFSAILILLIASINYINISLSRASQTQSEVGVRKVMGSSNGQLMGRFISETFISIFISSIIALGILALLLPYLNSITGKELPMASLFQPLSLIFLVAFITLMSIFIGLYPAYILSSPQISSILKKSGKVSNAGWLRKGLMTLQYAISVFLIICTVVIIRQTNYLINKPLGFNKDQTLVIPIVSEMTENALLFESELNKHPNIISTSTCRSGIGTGNFSTTVIPEGYSDELTTRIFGVDQEFFETYGIELNTGRTFLKGSLADSNQLVVNKSFVTFMGWEDPIGKHIRFSPEGTPVPIIGVVEDFHYSSLATSRIEPMILYLDTHQLWNTSVRIGRGDLRETIEYINDTWDRFAERAPLDFYFVDQWFNEQYKKETQLLNMATIYAVISMILCALGLYGLTALILQQRQKEISIRKVLGASVTSIVSLMNKQFILIIVISFLISAPLSFYLIAEWLETFQYQTNLGIYPFVIAILVTFSISVGIISWLSSKTANTNPSETLSNE
ncbi:ABC transporter permease [Ekhidna sp.]